jgi:hypothetical protein
MASRGWRDGAGKGRGRGPGGPEPHQEGTGEVGVAGGEPAAAESTAELGVAVGRIGDGGGDPSHFGSIPSAVKLPRTRRSC